MVVLNNWRFVKKQREFIDQNFEIGNLYFYIVRLAIGWALSEIVLPVLISTKSRARRRLKALSVSANAAGTRWRSGTYVKKLALLADRSQPPTTKEEDQDERA